MKFEHMMQGGAGAKPAYDEEKTIFFNKSMFDDKMFLEHGISGKDLHRAIVKYGIFEERLKQKEISEKDQNEQLQKIYEKFKTKMA